MHTEMSRPRNIYFDNVVVLGKQVESPSDLHMVVELSDDICLMVRHTQKEIHSN